MKATTIISIVLAAAIFAACNTNTPEGLPEQPQKINYPTEKQEAVTNDFTLVKACIGKSDAEIAALLKKHGFRIGNDDKYQKTEGGVTKIMDVCSAENVCMTVRSSDFSAQKTVFGQWVNQMRQSAAYTNLVRSTYSFSSGWGNGRQSCSTPEELLALVEPVSTPEGGMSASVNGNDCFANQYELILYPRLSAVYLQIYNMRVGEPSDDFTKTDLKDEDLHKHILISKVDYLTFRHKGFYAMDVSGKIDSGTDIPFLTKYRSPGDFGSITLFYQDESNLLLDGTIIWSGCGTLSFPASFRAGLPLQSGLTYPGQERLAFIGDDGKYTTVNDERDLQHIWECVSRQKEFQYYYTNSSKKAAVYLYTPSVGMMDPNVACYFVFTEQ